MPKLSIFGSLSNVQMLLHSFVKGTRVGVDDTGNVYYRGRARRGTTQERRWVIYAGALEASMVPAEWHGWLHRQTDVVPDGTSKHRRSWQKPHIPNLTGTKDTYLPPAMKGGHRDAATGDYTAWQPPTEESKEHGTAGQV